MKQKIQALIFSVIAGVGLLLPTIVLAQNCGPGQVFDPNYGCVSVGSGRGGVVAQGVNNFSLASLFGTSWLTSGNVTVWGLIVYIIKILLVFSGLIAVGFIIIGGYYYITAGGSSEQAGKGKTTVFNAVIGLVIIILSYVIVNVIVNTISSGFLNTGAPIN
ncbi:MAG TPA: hypothetical protein VEA59_00010 [Patescibacteria group bacterium]|nr:hypothetical protein [Patescibacteria group bacterium]